VQNGKQDMREDACYPSRPVSKQGGVMEVRNSCGAQRRPCCLSAVEFRPALPAPDK